MLDQYQRYSNHHAGTTARSNGKRKHYKIAVEQFTGYKETLIFESLLTIRPTAMD